MGYVTSNLMNDEEVIHMAKIHWFIYLPGITAIVISFIVLGASDGMKEIAPLLFFVFLVGGIISLVKAFIFKISTELAVTTKRVIAKTGLIKRNTLELNHSKVESFNIDQSIMGRIFNFGNVVVRGTGGGKTPIPNIDDPMLFRREAMGIIDKVENN